MNNPCEQPSGYLAEIDVARCCFRIGGPLKSLKDSPHLWVGCEKLTLKILIDRMVS